MDDDRLIDQLREAVEDADPVPPHLLKGAGAAFAWRTIDDELALLRFDSALSDEVLVRASGASAQLSFTTAVATIDVEVVADTIVGQAVPAPTAVELQCSDGDRLRARCDGAGQFRFDRPARGPVRLRVPYGGGAVVSEWFTV